MTDNTSIFSIAHLPRVIRLINNLLVLLIFIFYIATLSHGHSWGDDFSMYILHAENLLHGKNYTATGYIYNPEMAFVGPRAYPPVFPALLVPVIAIFGLNFFALKWVGAICLGGTLLWINNISVQNRMSQLLMAILLLCVGLNPILYWLTDYILSDLPFLLFCMLTLSVIQLELNKKHDRNKDYLSGVLIGGLIYLAYGTRSIGLVLLPVLVVYDLVRNRKVSKVVLLSIVVFGLLFLMQSVFIKGTESYLEQFPRTFPAVMDMLRFNLQYYLSLWVELFPFEVILFRYLFLLFLCTAALAGVLTRARKGLTVYEVFFLLYQSFLLFWPSLQGVRFLIPIIPLFFISVFFGFQWFNEKFIKLPVLKLFFPLLFLLIMLHFYVPYYTATLPKPKITEITTQDSQDLFTYVKQYTEPGDIIQFVKPRALALLTGRNSFRVAPYSSDEKVFSGICKLGGSYIIVALNYIGEDQPRMVDLTNSNPLFFTPIFANDSYRMYRVNCG